MDSEEIAERGAKSISQIFVNDAAVYTPTSSSTTDWWGTQIRGLPVRNSYIDDIPMLLYWGGDFPTEITEEVTALKGLTGFMYGFGEPGGALIYTLKRPKVEDETTATVGYRNSSLLSAHIDTSQNLGSDLAVRANLATEQGKAYNESDIDRKVVSLAFDKRFGDSLNWFTTLAYEDNTNTGEPLQFYFDEYDVAGSGGKLPSVTYNYDDINVDNSWYNTETTLASTGLQWQFNDQWGLKYQVGFSRKEHYSNKSFANILNRHGDYSGNSYNFAGKLDNLFTQLMLQGMVETGGIRHEIVGGVGMQRAQDTWGNEWYWENDFNGNLYQEQTFRTTRTPDFSWAPESSDLRQLSPFVSDTLHFNEQWQAIIGLRHTDYEQRDTDYKIRNNSPTLALIYKPEPQTSIYGSYVEGLEPGTRVVNSSTVTYVNAGDVLDATVSKQYEVGLKHESGDIDLTSALFRIDRVNEMDVWRDGNRYREKDGLLIYQGLDLSGAYQFTDNLNIGLGAVYLDATIDNMADASSGIEGNDPAFTPEWQIVANTKYLIPGVDGLKLHGNVRYLDDSYVSDNNTLELPGRTVTNGGFSYEFGVPKQNWELTGNVYNLFNTQYWAGGGWGSGNVGEARNFALTLSKTF